jgi:aquaporin Z
MAVILFMGGVSGAHLNPVVSVAFALRRDFPWRRCFGYVLAQLIGATLACAFLLAVFGDKGKLGATLPGAGIHDWQAMLIELALTAGLVSTILGTASTAQNVGAFPAIAVGGYIVLAGLWSSPVSGASMNPARSFAPDALRWDFASFWVYVVGPFAGALLAVAFASVLRGPGGGVGGRRAAAVPSAASLHPVDDRVGALTEILDPLGHHARVVLGRLDDIHEPDDVVLEASVKLGRVVG